MGVFVGEKMLMYSLSNVSMGFPYVTSITTYTNEFVDYTRQVRLWGIESLLTNTLRT